jgi:hypothetical protein
MEYSDKIYNEEQDYVYCDDDEDIPDDAIII